MRAHVRVESREFEGAGAVAMGPREIEKRIRGSSYRREAIATANQAIASRPCQRPTNTTSNSNSSPRLHAQLKQHELEGCRARGGSRMVKQRTSVYAKTRRALENDHKQDNGRSGLRLKVELGLVARSDDARI